MLPGADDPAPPGADGSEVVVAGVVSVVAVEVCCSPSEESSCLLDLVEVFPGLFPLRLRFTLHVPHLYSSYNPILIQLIRLYLV